MKKDLWRKGKSSIVKKCNHWNENPNLTIKIEQRNSLQSENKTE